jgi:hypothetical protein
VGLTITGDIQDAIGKIPAGAWTQAYDGDGDGEPRYGAWVAEIAGMPDLDGWPAGMRSSRMERPHPGRSCGSPTSTGSGSPAWPPRRAGSSRTWSCGTAAGRPGEGSASLRTPACAICR